jgi:hypothetical protein
MTVGMRRILLALCALGCISSAAEATQRDQRSGQPASRTAQQAKPPQAQARPAAQATRSTQARPAAQPTRTAQAQPRGQQASNLRPGDVRTSSGGVLVRGASAATVSRDASARATAQPRRNAVAHCTQRDARTVCAPARSSVAGWQSGLPVANFAQRECPDGTFATLARGHDDIVRCMPL